MAPIVLALLLLALAISIAAAASTLFSANTRDRPAALRHRWKATEQRHDDLRDLLLSLDVVHKPELTRTEEQFLAALAEANDLCDRPPTAANLRSYQDAVFKAEAMTTRLRRKYGELS